jgi:hypothetical protein
MFVHLKLMIFCLHFLRARIIGKHHHVWLTFSLGGYDVLPVYRCRATPSVTMLIEKQEINKGNAEYMTEENNEVETR